MCRNFKKNTPIGVITKRKKGHMHYSSQVSNQLPANFVFIQLIAVFFWIGVHDGVEGWAL